MTLSACKGEQENGRLKEMWRDRKMILHDNMHDTSPFFKDMMSLQSTASQWRLVHHMGRSLRASSGSQLEHQWYINTWRTLSLLQPTKHILLNMTLYLSRQVFLPRLCCCCHCCVHLLLLRSCSCCCVSCHCYLPAPPPPQLPPQLLPVGSGDSYRIITQCSL